MFQFHRKDLEDALRVMVMPEKMLAVDDGLRAMQIVYRTLGPEKAVFNLVSLIAYLTSEEPGSADG